LKIIIKDIRETNHIVDEDKVVAHFLIQLFDLHKKQQEDEKDIREFIHVCDNYLARKDVVPGASGKAIVYDNLNFEIFVTQEYNSDSQPDRLPLQTLSSGEKQIISLFSHIYLSGASGYFIIIDEPELSLSVPWQKRFLPDILDTGKCDGLLAVTHSPFIFDNKLSASAHSIEEFIHSANYVS
jgi:AAA15 family ATPase/GTPase